MITISNLQIYLEHVSKAVSGYKVRYLMAQGKTLNGNYAECQLRRLQSYDSERGCASAIDVRSGEVVYCFKPQPFKNSRRVVNYCHLVWGRDGVRILLIPDELFELLVHLPQLLRCD